MYNPNKIFGVTTLDVVRANTFVAELKVRATSGVFHAPFSELLWAILGSYVGIEDTRALTGRLELGSFKCF